MKLSGPGVLGVLLLMLTTLSMRAQTNWPSPEIKQVYEKAQAHQARGELQAAIQIYRQAIGLAPHMSLLYRELGQALFYAGDYSGVQEVLEPMVSAGQADELSFRVLGSSYLAQSKFRKARRTLHKGLEIYPHSGILYYELGQVHKKNNRAAQAAEAWSAGIEKAPDFHLNYHALAEYYMSEKNYLMALIHGEIFVNLEQKTQRTKQTKQLIYDAYIGLFLPDPQRPFTAEHRKEEPWTFPTAAASIYRNLVPLAISGISTESLTMIRTRFIMEWEKNFAQLFPFTLFARHHDLIRNGYFDAYNQWLFGELESSEQFQAWNRFHEKAMPRLESWFAANPYLPLGSDFPGSP